MDTSHKNFQVTVKNVHTFDGKNAADFIGWYEKIRISLNIYDKATFQVLQVKPVPSAATDTDGPSRGLEHGQRRVVQRAVLHDERCSMLRRPPLCRQDIRRGLRTRTTRVGRPSRKGRWLFEGSA